MCEDETIILTEEDKQKILEPKDDSETELSEESDINS
jgi:hypothetical protein